MKMMLQQIKEIGKELKSNKLLTDITFSINKPFSKTDFTMFSSLKITLPEEVIAFYEEVNGFQLSWKMKADEDKVRMGELPFVGGEICIAGFAETFVFSWKNKIWFKADENDDVLTKKYNLFSQHMSGFDTSPKIFNNTQMTTVYLDKKESRGKTLTTLPFWFWNLKGIKFKLDLDFKSYINHLFETRGMFFWQSFFLDFEGMDFTDQLVREKLIPYLNSEIPKMQIFLDKMPILFPQTDISLYRPVVEKFKLKMKELNYPLN